MNHDTRKDTHTATAAMDEHELTEQLAAVSKTASQLAMASAGKPASDTLKAFAEAGLLGAIASEEVGGLDLAPAFATAIVRATGAELFADPVAQALVCSRLAAGLDREVAAAIVSGDAFATLGEHHGLTAQASGSGFLLTGTVKNVPFGQEAAYLLAPVIVGSTPGLALVELNHAHVKRIGAETLDLEAGRAHLSCTALAVAKHRVSTDANLLREFMTVSALLRSQWLEANARSCLTRTADYLATRRQFGQPLASLQSIRFTLAQCTLELESLKQLVSSATTMPDAARRSSMADMACAYAAAVCPVVAEKCLQLNGGMGYTWEVPMHRYLRRIRSVTDDLTAAAARSRVADALLSK